MSYIKVKEYFNNIGLGERVIVRDYVSDTVEHAAEAIGCEPARIAKTMSFLQDGKAVLVVLAGDAKIDNKKYKSCFHHKAVMVPGEEVETLIGHEPGAVCPFVTNNDVSVYLDVSLKRFNTIHTAGGSLNSTIQLSLEELVTYSLHSGWIDVGKGWNTNEDE